MKFCRTIVDRSAIYRADFVKARVAPVACILVALSVTGCGLDANVLAACRTERISGSHLTRYADPAGCRAAQQRAANEKSRLAENAERASRSRNAAARSRRRAQELNAFRAMTPAQQRKVREERAARERKAREAFAARQAKVRQAKAADSRKKRALAEAKSREPRKLWARERQLARQGNRANLRKYPRLAWLSGFWCNGLTTKRYKIADSGLIRMVFFRRLNGSKPAIFYERTYAVRFEGRLYVTTSSTYFRKNGPKKFPYYETAIRKLSDNEYSASWIRTVRRGGPERKYHVDAKYKRCATG